MAPPSLQLYPDPLVDFCKAALLLPDGDSGEDGSPVHRPTSSLWTPPVQQVPERIIRSEESTPSLFAPTDTSRVGIEPARSEEILFGPGVQLDQPAQQESLDDISVQVTRMEIDAPGADPTPPALEDGDFIDRAFSAPPPPPPRVVLSPPARVLRCEAVQAREPLARLKAKAQRASNRLAARPSSIPVSKRAQHRLIRELSFINKEEKVGDDAVAAYIDTYKSTLPPKAVAALRSATKLGNKAAASALATLRRRKLLQSWRRSEFLVQDASFWLLFR
ncbi:hypothetical protein C2845_PM12G10900 [Panicum miliaceum]|uniref:Uncharacterized protein n=1 Tax=Panicum miliaceum TaxID=4540 RepID=A0A3L6QKD1_PANMI|nr:hypothetical protein C2845_PM12G10900 [Panicum miliaceum]